MTIKIKTMKRRLWENEAGIHRCRPYRAVRESDWRKLMRLVKAVDKHHYHVDPYMTCDICAALVALEPKK